MSDTTPTAPASSGNIPTRWARWTRWLLADPKAGYVCATLFVLVALWAAITQRFLHDEAVFTYDQVATFYHVPIEIFFFAKGKPVLMLMYALPGLFGFQAYVIAHAFIGASAVLLVNAASRRLGLDAPNVAG